MITRAILAVLAVFITWSVADFVVHGVILASDYEATAQLWRPMEEMSMGPIYFTVLVSAIVFVAIYARFFAKKGINTGVEYGLWFGLGVGVSMGYGSYTVMPIPDKMAVVWFLASLFEGALGGLLLGWILGMKPREAVRENTPE
jgi:hypothetical protein